LCITSLYTFHHKLPSNSYYPWYLSQQDSDSENDWRDLEVDSDEDEDDFEKRVQQTREQYKTAKKERRKLRMAAEEAQMAKGKSADRKAQIKAAVMSKQSKRAREETLEEQGGGKRARQDSDCDASSAKSTCTCM